MAWDFKRELGRKAIHLLSIGFLVIYAYFSENFSHRVALLILGGLLIILLEFEYLRVELGMKIPIISLLWRYKRRSELKKLGAEIYFLIGAILSLALFDIRIAAAAILMTTFGDLTAALFGARFGKTKVKNLRRRTWEGVLAQLVVDIAVGWLFIRSSMSLWWTKGIIPFGDPIWPVIIVMALTATIVETLCQKLDDNLLIPLFAGFNGQMMFILLGVSVL